MRAPQAAAIELFNWVREHQPQMLDRLVATLAEIAKAARETPSKPKRGR